MGNSLFILKKTIKKNPVLTRIARLFFDAARNAAKRRAAAYIRKHYKHLFDKYNGLSVPQISSNVNYPVWTCWLQGEENMPETVKMCHHSLIKNAEGRKVTLITSDNYADFVDIPENIREKHTKGIISRTHYSDIIRIHLLCKYGGLWIDATTFVSGKLPTFDGFPYWTGRWNGGRRFSRTKQFTDFLSYCLPNDVLWSFLKDLYIDYWGKFDKLSSYHFLEVAMRCAYEDIESVKIATNAVPVTRQGMFDLYTLLNSEYDQETYDALRNEICFHKMTYKEDFRKRTVNGKQTFYGYLYGTYENDLMKTEGGITL